MYRVSATYLITTMYSENIEISIYYLHKNLFELFMVFTGNENVYTPFVKGINGDNIILLNIKLYLVMKNTLPFSFARALCMTDLYITWHSVASYQTESRTVFNQSSRKTEG